MEVKNERWKYLKRFALHFSIFNVQSSIALLAMRSLVHPN